MELFCKTCKKMPLIKFSFIEEGKILSIINCKCGRTFHDISTFIADYTNILNIDKEKKEQKIDNKIVLDNDLVGFCETCFENIYNNSNLNHEGHNIIKINMKDFLISKKDFETISEKLKLAENKIFIYLPEMRDMLLKDSKNDKEKKEIEYLSKINLNKNNLLNN